MTETRQFQLNLTGPQGDDQIRLKAGTAVFGRQVGVDILLEHPLVSRRHGQFDLNGRTLTLTVTDLGSSNGTLVNGTPLTANTPVTLKDGDVVQAGPFVMTVMVTAVAAEPPTPPPKPTPKPAKPEPSPTPKQPTKQAAPPPPPPSLPPTPPVSPRPASPSPFPPGLDKHSHFLLEYLPGIYHTDFMSRYLAIFESILLPIQWHIDNFDLYLNPGTVPAEFLPWLAGWFDVVFNDSWTEAQRRLFLQEAHQLFARRGTRWALARLLEIYLGVKPEIDDTGSNLDPFTFAVNIPLPEKEIKRPLVERLIDLHKPAHTSYKLRFQK
ncbi:MAG: hypothetical protein Kow0080_26480 [Candidatus Promineifilaceae bacterium]